MVRSLRRVLIVGGGAAGVVTAATLLREADGNALDIEIVERRDTLGRGLAYGTRERVHLLNNYAGRMSAFEDDPGHLVRWCLARGRAVRPETFLSRQTYGEYLSSLLAGVPGGSRVLLVGTGLTTVDVAAQITDTEPDVEIVAISRHGLLPLRHRSRPPVACGRPVPAERTLAAALRAVRAAGAGDPDHWRELVETVKAGFNERWQALPYAEQQSFVRHVARYWEVARHRMAPDMADLVEGLLLDGRLRVTTPTDVSVEDFDLVVNCTGPAPAATPGWNPLVDGMATRGMLRPGPHGLGLDIDRDGRLLDEAGVPARAIHVIGAARRGVEWEVAAIPDIRRQAKSVAGALGVVPSDISSTLVG